MSHDNLHPNEITEVFKTYYADPTNCKCMDCGADAREWVSVNNAVSLCGECAANHSHFNEHISVLRQCVSPDWKWEDLMLIRNGGNMKFKLFMDEWKLNTVPPLNKYKTKAAFFYRRKLRHLCEGKPAPKAPKQEDALEEVEHDNFLDKIADFFTGIFGDKKEDENIEAHPGPLREETQAQGLLAPRIQATEGLKSDSFRPELNPNFQQQQIPAQAPAQAPAPAKEFPFKHKERELGSGLHGNYEKKDWIPSQPMEQKHIAPSTIQPASLNKDLKEGEERLHQLEDKEIGEAKSTFEKIRDKAGDMIHESFDKLKEGVHKGAALLTGEEDHPIKKDDEHPIKQEEKQPIKHEELPKEEHHFEATKEEKAPEAEEAPKEKEEEPELDIYRVLRHTKSKEIIDHDIIMHWKHEKDEKELQSLAGEAAESVKARVMPSTTKSRAAQIAQQAAMIEAARGLTKLSKGADCEHEVRLHGHVDFEYIERLEQLAEDTKKHKKLEDETPIEEIRKSEDFGVPEIFRANIKRLSSTAPEPTGHAAPQKILSLKKKERRDARLARKKQRDAITAQQPDHTKLTQHPLDISLSPLEKKIQMKQLEGFLLGPLDSAMLPSSLQRGGVASPRTPKHSNERCVDFFGKPIIKASTAHLQPLTSRNVRRKHYFKQIHKKEEEAHEEGAKPIEEIAKKIPKKNRNDNRKLSLAEKFKQKVMGSFELAKEKATEGLELVRGNSGAIIDKAAEKLEHVKERATEKLEQVKESAIVEAAKEKIEIAKEKVKDTYGWIKEKLAGPAAQGVKVAEPEEPAPQTEESDQLKPVGLNETGEFAAKQITPAEKSLEHKDLLKERHF